MPEKPLTVDGDHGLCIEPLEVVELVGYVADVVVDLLETVTVVLVVARHVQDVRVGEVSRELTEHTDQTVANSDVTGEGDYVHVWV